MKLTTLTTVLKSFPIEVTTRTWIDPDTKQTMEEKQITGWGLILALSPHATFVLPGDPGFAVGEKVKLMIEKVVA